MLWDYLIFNVKIGGSGLSLLEPAQEEPDIGTSLLPNLAQNSNLEKILVKRGESSLSRQD